MASSTSASLPVPFSQVTAEATSALKNTTSANAPIKPQAVEQHAIYTINDLLRARAKDEKGRDPIVAYPSSGTNYTYYTPLQLDVFVEAASIHYASVIPQRRSPEDPVQVVGLLGPSDFEYLITLLAISRLGHTVLFLSTRIAKDAYVSLIENTHASFLIAHPAFRKVAESAGERTGVAVQSILEREDYENSSTGMASLPPTQLDGQTEAKHICWIIHSSGSTGNPKPIFQTHSGALHNYAHNVGLRGFITLPLFHAHGVSCLFRAIHSRKLIYLYNANLPLTAPYLLTVLREHREIEILYAVPYALKLLSESQKGLEILADLDLVMFGGSSCPKPIGDTLVQNGVRLVSHYGTTETGQLMTSFRDRSDLDWDYVRPGTSLLPYLQWEERAPGIYELCVLDGWPSKVASNRPDGSYATKDLFEKHPTRPNAWRYYARLDDTIVLENGEKANPLIVEGEARNNPNVREAVAFGANRPRLGLFLIRAAASACATDGEIIDYVLPAIEQCNAVSPAYAYISRDMIRVLPSDTTYRATDKGTVIRAAFYRDFEEQINKIYDTENNTNGEDLVLEGAELAAFLRKSLLAVAPIDPSILKDSSDIFGLGVDSLQSIRLRTIILKNLDLGGRKLSQNFAFENPSLRAMAEELTRLRLAQDRQEEIPVEERMERLIEKYGSSFRTHVPVPPRDDSDGEHILVTGATGSLGAHIVAQLARMDRVRTIYCIVRAESPGSAVRRVRQSLQARRLSSNLSSDAEGKIVALQADLSNPVRLGLDESTYERLLQSVTAVIHCAWAVNFNWTLESFEESCIAGTRNLLDLCLRVKQPHPARFSFCSSVSSVARTPGNWIPEALPESLSYAQGMGYAQSKLVTEHIVDCASRQTGMTARVLRVGQVVADTVHGIWNSTEAISMILQTAETIKTLPQLDDILSWTPVDVMATSIIDLSLALVASDIMNVTNPTLDHWTRSLLPLLREAGLDFEEVPGREWLRRLRNSNPDPSVNPPIKLIEFFTNKYDNENPSRVLLYDTKKAQAGAPVLRQVGGLTAEFVTRFVNYFRSQCWSQPAA